MKKELSELLDSILDIERLYHIETEPSIISESYSFIEKNISLINRSVFDRAAIATLALQISDFDLVYNVENENIIEKLEMEDFENIVLLCNYYLGNDYSKAKLLDDGSSFYVKTEEELIKIENIHRTLTTLIIMDLEVSTQKVIRLLTAIDLSSWIQLRDLEYNSIEDDTDMFVNSELEELIDQLNSFFGYHKFDIETLARS